MYMSVSYACYLKKGKVIKQKISKRSELDDDLTAVVVQEDFPLGERKKKQ